MPKRVLLVDDQDVVRKAFVAMYSRYGHEIETASNTEEATLKIRNGNFDCIFVDANIAKNRTLDGVDFAVSLAEAQHTVCIFTANSKGISDIQNVVFWRIPVFEKLPEDYDKIREWMENPRMQT